MIPESEIDSIRTEQELYMPSLVTVLRDVPISPEDEGVDTTPSVSCRITAGFGPWRNVADQFAGIEAFHLTFHWDQDILPGDRVVDAAAHTYRVRAVKVIGSYITAKQVLTELIT